MAGFDNKVVYADNVDFSGASPVTPQVLLDGQLLIGSTATPHIRVNTLTAGTGIAITNGTGTITISNTGGGGGGGGATSLAGNTGSAPNIAGVINVIGSTGLTTNGDGIQTLTITPTGNLLALQGLSGTGYVVHTGSNTFVERTFLAGSGISLSNADGVAGATTITAGATVPTTFTEDTGSAIPAANNINIFGTSAQGISTSGAGATVTITAANATSTQKGVASFNATEFTVTAGAVASNAITVTAGTGLTTGGVVNLGGSVTLALDIPVTVAHGGTGDITLTNHGVMLGQGTSAVVVTAAGTNGQVLIGGTGVDPAFATIAGTQGVTLTGGSNTLSIGLVNVPNSALQNSSITVTGGAGISVTGSPVSLGGAVTISATGTIVTQFSADVGTATPSGNNINLLGTAAQGLSTSASGATVTFTNANWSTTQKGVGTLATNAEAIAGSVSDEAITPASLAAKLGTQTLHGFAIGGGSTNAITWTAEPINGQLPIGSTGNSPVLSTLTAGTGITITNAAGSITIASSAVNTKFTKFTASGTWTKDSKTVWVKVIGMAAGSGGGSGRRGAAGTARSGGGGASGAGYFYYEGPTELFGATETVTISSGGTGGAAQTVNDTNGNNGTAGGDTQFGNMSTYNGAQTNYGNGGTTTTGSGGSSAQYIFTWTGLNVLSQSAGGNGDDVSAQDGDDYPSTTGTAESPFINGTGGGGGGITSGNLASAGGRGGNLLKFDSAGLGTPSTLLAGGTAGTVGAGQAGGAGNNRLTTGGVGGCGTGGGGGAGSITGAAGAGGAGGVPGGAGGGGGASLNGNNSGAGGNGGRGEVWVIEQF